jgi:molecular chaperone GrpE
MMNRKKDDHKKHDKDFLNPEEQKNPNTTQGQSVNEQDNQNEIPVIFDSETELENKIAELTTSLATANDKYLRLSAEFDNFRKRTLKEKMDLMKNASESVMVNFLPVVDDVERAMKAIEATDNLETIKEGIVLIYNKFKDFTKNNGVVEMEAYGLELNTDHHEAITKIPAPSDDLKGKIVDVVQKGYLLNDKVIRYAKVVIGE